MASFFQKIFFLLLSSQAQAFSLRIKEGTLIQDSEIESFLSMLVAPALKTTPHVPKVSFHLIADPMINAFTAGEPSIFIHTGLIERSERVEDIIGVLLHELGHIVGHHVIQQIAEIKRTRYHTLIPALLGLMAAGTSGRWELMPMGVSLGQLHSTVAQLGHSRDHEYFADRFALKTLAYLGWPPSCFFHLMQTLTRQDQSDYPLYLRTHPFAKDRLSVAPSPSLSKEKTLPPSFAQAFNLAKIKVIAFVTPLPQALQSVEHAKVSASAKQYGRSIVAYRSGDYMRALSLLKQFEAHKPTAFTQELKAQILFESRRFEDALKAIESALSLRPEDPNLAAYRAQILIEKGEASKAIPLLERLLLSSSAAELWYWLAVAYGKTNHMGRMKICMAEYELAMGNEAQARLNLESGLKILPPHDTYYQRAEDLKLTLSRP